MPYLQKQYEPLFDHLMDIVLIIHQSGKILYANRAAEKAYKYDSQVLSQLRIHDLRKSDADEIIENQLNMALLSGIEFQAVHYRSDGTGFPVMVRSIYIEGGQGDEVISIIQDRSRQSLLEHKANWFDTSMDMAEEAVIVTDEAFKITFWSRAASERFGFGAAELLGQSVSVLVPENKQDELKVIKELLKMGRCVQSLETTRVNKMGEVIDVSVSYSPLLKPEGQPIGFLGVYTDITEKKQAELKLRLNQEKAAKALEGAHFCIWEIDLIKKTIDTSGQMPLMLGYVEEEGNQRLNYWTSKIHLKDQGLIRQTYKGHSEALNDFIIEFRMKNAVGHYDWLRAKGKITERSEKGRPLKMLGTTELINDRKQIEAELLQKNAILEQVTAEAKQANEAKSQFLANMSHEIRTPLNGIVTVTQLLAQTALNESQLKLVKLLEASSETLKGIVTDILDLSKAERQKIEIDKVEFSIKEMCQMLLTELQVLANQKGLEAGFYFDPRIEPYLIGDAQKLKQILNNLIANAVKFTDEGYIGLKILEVSRSDQQTVLRFEVKDSGIGVSEPFQSRIFEPFMQGDLSSEKKYGGTGLGLAIAKHYAEVMGGRLFFESTANKGSVFVLECPFELTHSAAPEIAFMTTGDVLNSQKETLKPMSVPSKRILAIDDNYVNQSVIEMLVEKMGHVCIKAYCAEEAMASLESHAIDLMLMDIQLPVTNGYTLTATLREDERYSRIPIIAMTAYSRQEDQEKCLAAGMDAYITKPLDLEHLKQLIQMFI